MRQDQSKSKSVRDMRGGHKGTVWRRGASQLALASFIAVSSLAPAAAQAQTSLAMATQGREMELSVSLVSGNQALGSVLVRISAAGQMSYEAQALREQLLGLLNDEGRAKLFELIGSQTFVDPAVLAASGFDIQFNQNRLELNVARIDARYRALRTLGEVPRREDGAQLAYIRPAKFSAFVNLTGNVDYEEGQTTKPELYIFGAARYKDVVVELDGALSDQFGQKYGFYRRSLRAFYDLPEKYMRVSAGDLRPDTTSLLRTPYIGGVAVERRKQTFGGFLPSPFLAGREIFLDTNSTVEVLVNGAEYQTFQLDAGRYDLASLPLQFGSNNIQLRVRDATGRQQLIDYNYFFEQIDLEPGDFEYSVAVGALGRTLSFQPSYSKKIAAIGFYRKALSSELLLGGGAQITDNRQLFAAEASIVPQVVPGIFDFQAAYSRGDKSGVALRGNYRLRTGKDIASRRQISLSFDYQGKGYQTLDDLAGFDLATLTLNVNYTQSFSTATFGSVGFTYVRQSDNRPTQTLTYAEVSHRLNNRFRITGGVEYGKDNVRRTNFGVRFGIIALFGGDKRANVDYRSRLATTRANFSKSSGNNVGSFGYDFGLTDSPGDVTADANFNYIGNRFDARASLFSRGNDFGSITDRKGARLQVGTSLAFADGAFGVGRPIYDSFAVLKPHSSLPDEEVVSGRSLKGDRYEARSGLLGGAIQSNLGSYAMQNFQYDFGNAEAGYDVGDGLARVNPPFHSGYKIVVGSDRNVSAVGVLLTGDKPVSLVTGEITSQDDEGFEKQTFFTNSAGRYGIIGLAPGKTYLVTLNDGQSTALTISVPADTGGLYRMGRVDLLSRGK